MTLAFWQGAGERAVKTSAQALLGVLMSGATGILDVDWVAALSIATLATAVSLLTSLATPDFAAGAPPTTGTRASTRHPTRATTSPTDRPHTEVPPSQRHAETGAPSCVGPYFTSKYTDSALKSFMLVTWIAWSDGSLTI